MPKKLLSIAVLSLLTLSSPFISSDVFAYTYDGQTADVTKVKEDASGLVVQNNSDLHVSGDLSPDTGYRSGDPVGYNCVTYHIGAYGIRNLPDGIDASVAKEIIQSLKDGTWNKVNSDYPGLNIHVTNLKDSGRGGSNPFWEGNDISVEAANRFNYENLSAARQAELDGFLNLVNSNDDLIYVNGRWATAGKCGGEVFTNWKDFVGGEDVYTITNPIWNSTGDAEITIDDSQVIVDGNSSTSEAVNVQNNSFLMVNKDASYGSLTVENSDVEIGNNLTVQKNGLNVDKNSSISVANTLTVEEGPLNMEKGSTLDTSVLQVNNPGETSTIGSDTNILGNLGIDGTLSGVKNAVEDTDATNLGQVKDMIAEQGSEFDEKLDNKANVDASNVDAETWGKVIATGKVEEGDVRAVSGDTLYRVLKDNNESINNQLAEKADRDLSNITESGKQVIRDTVQGDMDKKADKSYVDEKFSEKADKSYVDTQLDAKADKAYVEKELNQKANVDASNIEGHEKDWADKLGVGKVEQGNQYLVTGDTVYSTVNKMIDETSLVKSDGSIIAVGKNDTATKVDISGPSGNRVLTGVTTDASDSSSAANVGYVNDVASSLSGNMDAKLQGLESSLTGQINQAGAQAAALANLDYLPYEEGEGKYNFAIGVGNYGSSTSTALGMKYYANRNFSWNISTTLGDSKNMVGGGISMRFGPSAKKHKQVVDTQEDKAKIAQLEMQVSALMKRLDDMSQSLKPQASIPPRAVDVPRSEGQSYGPVQFVDYSELDTLLDSMYSY